MLDLAVIRQKLEDRRPSRVAKATGLHITTIMAVRDGKRDPLPVVQKVLSDYLEA